MCVFAGTLSEHNETSRDERWQDKAGQRVAGVDNDDAITLAERTEI